MVGNNLEQFKYQYLGGGSFDDFNSVPQSAANRNGPQQMFRGGGFALGNAGGRMNQQQDYQNPEGPPCQFQRDDGCFGVPPPIPKRQPAKKTNKKGANQSGSGLTDD